MCVNLRVVDPDPVSDGDDGSQAGGGGHPAAALTAVGRVPGCPVHARADGGAAGAREGRLPGDVPRVRRGRRDGNTVGGQGTIVGHCSGRKC